MTVSILSVLHITDTGYLYLEWNICKNADWHRVSYGENSGKHNFCQTSDLKQRCSPLDMSFATDYETSEFASQCRIIFTSPQ